MSKRIKNFRRNKQKNEFITGLQHSRYSYTNKDSLCKILYRTSEEIGSKKQQQIINKTGYNVKASARRCDLIVEIVKHRKTKNLIGQKFWVSSIEFKKANVALW